MAFRWAIACVCLATAVACAQTTGSTGTIQGSVTDQHRGVLPGVRVTARNQDTMAERRTETDASGAFTIRGLPLGTYTLTLESSGFATVSVAPFLLSVGQTIVQHLEMRPAGLVERVEVKEEPEAVDTSAATSGVALGYERIEEAPARSRNYLNFVLAAPAVAPSAGASSQRTMTGVRSPLGDSGFTSGGMRARNNSILIDGMDNRDETTGGNRVAVGLEMVQEFRVAGSAVGAELGGASGGLLNMVTRSGVNIWHGDFTFFAQNEVFNAKKPEVDAGVRPRFRRYQPGVSANGPLRRDRTFISGAIELERESAEEWSNVAASDAELISRALSSDRFSGTHVRVNRGIYNTSTRGVELSTKLNHQFNEKDTVSARYAFSRGQVRHEVQGPDNFADRSAQGNSLTTDHSLVGNWLRVVSPTVVNEVRMQASARTMDLSPNSAGAMLEIPGVATMGPFYRLDSDRTERHYQFIENLNFVLQHHRMSAGVDIHVVSFDASMRNRYSGIFVFPTLDDFTLGRPDIFIQAFGNASTSFRTVPFGAWLQDRWEPRRGLLIELGIRFDRQRMPEGINHSSNNFAPRVGIAWRPLQKRPLVLRSAFGLFYDRYPLAFLNDALQKDGVRGFEQYAAGPDAIAAFTLSHGAPLSAPLPGLGPSIYRTAPEFTSAYSRKYSAGFEYGIRKDTSLSMEASHVRGFHLPRVRNDNASLPPLYLLEQSARSDYLGASISLNRRMTNDFAYLIAYNIGRTSDDGSDFDEQPLNPRNARQDWALSRQHQEHRFSASAIFELPDEILPSFLREGFNDVSFAPICNIGSGRPINALLSTDLYRTGAYPITARPAGIPRNPYRSPATASLDLRVMKTFKVHEGRALLQFGVESFNLLNHTNTERVSQFYATPQSRLQGYGQILESLPARQIQFLVQFEY